MIVKIVIQGLVQGVGFRPFVYLLANELGIKGEVSNSVNGVTIQAQLTDAELETFVHRIRTEHPPVAVIHHISIEKAEDANIHYAGFKITGSKTEEEQITQVAPDIAVCDACLHDRREQQHRTGYPFINCTHCGPRFSIIEGLPYDRANTTMSDFGMCDCCQSEYTDIQDRRFHAQPVACNRCGPVYYAVCDGVYTDNYTGLLDRMVRLIDGGEVIAVKGIGGYHLVCDALNEEAVEKLRNIKYRDTKPFAVMFADIGRAQEFVYCNDIESELLTSWRRPVIILRQHTQLAQGINPTMNTLGVMLPYMPIHYDWFERIDTPAVVMTSGNVSELPIAITPEEAEKQFGGKAALILHHNRTIRNRVDDSVVQVVGSQPCIIRRSRGYVPEPFFSDSDMEGILAFGAEKTNTFALGKGNTCIQSQYIGDLKNWETFSFYKESMSRFQLLFRFMPKVLVCDLHPDYLSSKYADEVGTQMGLPLIHVQHHHAHAAACMLEYGLNEKVIAAVWDGTGLGDDGNAWGGEFLLCDRKGYSRLSHFEYIPMPGGDLASKEPWRMAVAYLHHYGLAIPEAFAQRIGKEKIQQITTMIDRRVNCPLTSSAGRLFDALASLLGLCDVATHQAQAAVLLEQTASDNRQESYPVELGSILSVRTLFVQVLDDMDKGISTANIAARIHNTLANIIFGQAKKLLKETGTEKVVLSGGCFQNKRLTEDLQDLFSKAEISLYIPSLILCNDGGIAAGQLAIAATRLKNMNSDA